MSLFDFNLTLFCFNQFINQTLRLKVLSDLNFTFSSNLNFSKVDSFATNDFFLTSSTDVSHSAAIKANIKISYQIKLITTYEYIKIS